MSWTNKSLTELSQALANGECTSVELTQAFLDQAKSLNAELNAFITLDEQGALAQAKAADEKRAKGQASSALCGIPIAHKDIFCTQDTLTTCGSRMLSDFIPPYDATVTAKLKEAGAVIIGKTNMDEFAMGSSNETSFFGAVKNPWDTNTVPGGSSGGSASAVAARMAPGATATDTGGSIRQPASLCGITGLKPTYGRVSRWGMIAFASSLDQAGTMTQSAEDAAMLLQEMAGFDEKDSTSLNEPVPNYLAALQAQDPAQPLAGIKLGLPKEFLCDALNEQVKASVLSAAETLKSLGAEVIEVSLPHNELAIPAYYVIAPAECSTNLSRYDGVRYGYRCEEPKDLEDLYLRTRSEGFGTEVKRRILIGTYALSAGFYDAYYRKAQQVRRLIKEDFNQVFTQVDALIGPACPGPAFGFDAKGDDPVAMYLEDMFTISTNLAGLPALSMPGGLVNELPIGIQLIGNYLEEGLLLKIAHQYQQVTDWHKQAPKLATQAV